MFFGKRGLKKAPSLGLEKSTSLRMQCTGRSNARANGCYGETEPHHAPGFDSAGVVKLGLIAGNGRFPFLLLDAARAQGLTVVVAAIREETDAEIDLRAAADDHIPVHWLSLGELSRLIELFHKEGVQKAVRAGQVAHKRIFSSILLDRSAER